jgi:hypothetical protein
MDQKERGAHGFRSTGVVQPCPESRADGTGFILVGNSVQMARRNRSHDHEREGGKG